MPIKVIGKSILGDLGFCQAPSKMGVNFFSQLKEICDCIFLNAPVKEIAMTSMTGSTEVALTNGAYVPKIRCYDEEIRSIFNPYDIYGYCKKELYQLRPGADFIIWDSEKYNDLCVTTFSREAPIIAFESQTGKALGIILRPSLMAYGDYLFSTIKKYLGDDTTVTLVTCNHYQYPEGSIPSIVKDLALKHKIKCFVCVDSEKDPECYHRGEQGNHVVAMW